MHVSTCPPAAEADIYSLPEGGQDKYDLLEEIGQGTYGLVHRCTSNIIYIVLITSSPLWHHAGYLRAVETSSGTHLAVKIIENFEENIEDIVQEYKILYEHSLHPNIPLLHGAYRSADQHHLKLYYDRTERELLLLKICCEAQTNYPVAKCGFLFWW